MPISFKSIPPFDPCLKDDCTVCLDPIIDKSAEAHANPHRRWQGLCQYNQPALYHPIHKTCQQEWFKTQKMNNRQASCPLCREQVHLSLKDRVFVQLNLNTVDGILETIASVAAGIAVVASINAFTSTTTTGIVLSATTAIFAAGVTINASVVNPNIAGTNAIAMGSIIITAFAGASRAAIYRLIGE